MASYYYLVAGLPTLLFDEPPPITPAELTSRGEAWLEPDEASDVRAALAGRLAGARTPGLRAWREQETELRNAVARQRAARRRADAGPYLRPARDWSAFIERGVAEAFQKPQPLERELALDRLRWALLDDFPGIDPFGFAAVAAYALKLALVQRWHGLTAERGRAALDAALARYRTSGAPDTGRAGRNGKS